MKTSEVLNRAADVIETRGWIQGGRSDPWGIESASGPVCIEGALVAALELRNYHPDNDEADTNFRECSAYMAVRDYLHIAKLWHYNDFQARVKSEVVEVLRATAVIEAARESEMAQVTA